MKENKTSSKCVTFLLTKDRVLVYYILLMKRTISLSNFRKIKINKWDKKEEEYLLRLVGQLTPKTTTEWDILCQKMHEIGSRRSLKEYRAKYKRQMNKKKQRQGNINVAFKEEIYKQFQLGKHPNQILQDLDISCCNTYKIRNILTYKFNSIKNHLKKIVGASKVKEIAIDDYQLFRFIKKQNLQLLPFQNFKVLTKEWKQAKIAKNYEQLRTLSQIFKGFNDNLHHYQKMFNKFKNQLQKSPSTSEVESSIKQKYTCDRSGTSNSKLAIVCKKIQITEQKSSLQLRNIDHKRLSQKLYESDLNDIFYPGQGQSQKFYLNTFNRSDLNYQEQSCQYWKFSE